MFWVCAAFFLYGVWNVLLTLWYGLKTLIGGKKKYPKDHPIRDKRQEAALAILVSWTIAAYFYYVNFFR